MTLTLKTRHTLLQGSLSMDFEPLVFYNSKLQNTTTMGFYTIFQDKGGKFRFNLHAANAQVILSSQGYASASGRDNGIESVRVNSQIPERYERLDAKSGDFYFVLKAANQQVIGQSQMYKSIQGRDNGIESVTKNGPSPEVRPA